MSLKLLPSPRPEDDPLERIAKWHAADIQQMQDDLLRGVPTEGGRASRATMERLLQCAFTSGAVSQHDNPCAI